MQLITFHFAGGNKVSLAPVKKHLPPAIKLVNLEFPGRTDPEQLYRNIYQVADAMFAAVLPYVGAPYAFWGHSMGTTVSFLVAGKLRDAGQPLPARLFLSGRMGPSFPFLKERLHQLPREEFIAALRKFNGVPEALLNEPAAIDYFLPVLKADFEAIENYVYQPGVPLDVPFTVFYGNGEKMDERILEASWQRESSHPVHVRRFPGGHFFIHQQWKEVAMLIQQELEQICIH